MNPIVLLTALFLSIFDGKAVLRIRGVNDATMKLQIIHGSIHGLKSYDFAGNVESEVISVQDDEVLTILAYNKEYVIVGSAIFEVRTALMASHEVVLAPCCSNNVIVDQCEFGQVERAFDRSLERAETTSESSEVL